MKTKKKSPKRKPKPTLPTDRVFAHGATLPVEFVVRKLRGKFDWPEIMLNFGSTVACDHHKRPVSFYRLDDMKRLHTYIGKCIEYAEAKGIE